MDKTNEMREAIIAAIQRDMPITATKFNEWSGWPGNWTLADVAIKAMRPFFDELQEQCALEAERWQRSSRPDHKCGEYISAAIRGIGKEPVDPLRQENDKLKHLLEELKTLKLSHGLCGCHKCSALMGAVIYALEPKKG